MLYNIIKIKVNKQQTTNERTVDLMVTTKIDTRKLDMIFFMSLETNTNLTYEQIESIANKHSAKVIYKYWQHMKRTN